MTKGTVICRSWRQFGLFDKTVPPRSGLPTCGVGNCAGQVHADIERPVGVRDFLDLFVAPRHAAKVNGRRRQATQMR
jgi:hypothetical protein